MRLPENGYLHTAWMAATVVGDSPSFLFNYALRLLRVLVLLSIWRTILSDAASSSGGPLGLSGVLTYTLIAEVFREQLNLRTSLNQAFWEGTLVMRLLRPMGLIRQLGAETAGPWLVEFVLFSLPLLVLAPALGVDARPVSAIAGALFGVSLGLAIFVGLCMELVFGALVVALDQPVWLVEYVRAAIATLLSGALLPLAYYPWNIGDAFAWLPFAAVAWAPLAIYTGADDALLLLIRQLIWAVVLWQFGQWLWRTNREKLASYGG